MMLDELENAEIKARVAKGFNLLTREQRDMVNVHTLNMDSDWNCVLGQIFGRYATGMDALFPETDPMIDGDYEDRDRVGSEYGFFQTYADDFGFEKYDALQDEWVNLLCSERESTLS
jgi:hypothetical protein